MKVHPPEEAMSLTAILRNYHFVSDECAEAMVRLASTESYDKKKPIVVQGEDCDSLYFISSGLVRVSFAKGDKEDTVCFGSAGDVFMSFHALYGNEPCAFSLFAVDDVFLYRISNRKFAWLQQKYPELYKWMCSILTEQLYSFEVLYRKLALQSPEERMVNFWDFEADSLRNLPPKYLTRIVPLKILAQYIGVTPQTLSKLRRKLVLRDRGKKTI